jgi:hypothetical protein
MVPGQSEGNARDLSEIQRALETGRYFGRVPLKPETVVRLKAQEQELLQRQDELSKPGVRHQP